MTPPASKPPPLWRNPLSLFGAFIAAVATAFGLPMMCIDMFQRHTDPYLATVIYMVLPLVAIGGTGILLCGMWWEHSRRLRHPERELRALPILDLNRPAHQAALLGGGLAVLVVIVLLSVTGYRAYHFTESTKFCGLVCHQVMKPEYTAYQHSPHARVACTQCHVGPGADWYVRSKLSGLYQVYSVATKRYPRPIQTPVENLRPAQDTCEQCHWPAKFFGATQKTFAHALADEQNSPWNIQMLIRVGGGDGEHEGQATGIHWHMNIAKPIEYIASDERRQVIPWVRVTEPDGQRTVYQSADSPLSNEQVARAEVRRMDCIDCHNRPAHVYRPPGEVVEQALEAGQLDRRLPYLKREAVRLMTADYQTEPDALRAIREGLQAFYQTEYPDLVQHHPEVVQRAAEELGRLFARNSFPEMRTDWRTHPNHIGHMTSDGCFRCHDGLHATSAGKIITNDCNACHTILAQGPPPASGELHLSAQAFQHPVDLGMDVTGFKCSECHGISTSP